jgi:hypothetical protein
MVHRLAALAADVHLGDVATGAALLDPELPAALRGPFVDEAIPVDVADVPLAAGADKAERHDRVLLPVLVDELALGQRLAVDQQPRQHLGLLGALGVGLQLLALRRIPAWRANTGAARIAGANGRRRFVRFNVKGCADVLAVLPPSGRLLAVECKMPGRRPSADQRAFLDNIAGAGGLAVVVRDLGELMAALEDACGRG